MARKKAKKEQTVQLELPPLIKAILIALNSDCQCEVCKLIRQEAKKYIEKVK